jgi:crotonobetainyl-CoA:carnitine CoA-transferase CaiB-like acyl-CoA transferase
LIAPIKIDRRAWRREPAASRMEAAMKSAREALSELWQAAGGEPGALARATLTGAEPALPSSFAVGTAAQAAIAAAGLAASEIWKARTGRAQSVAVDMRHAAVEFRSERYLRIDGGAPASLWDPIAGIYASGDGKFLRLHTNFPHHRDNILTLLHCGNTREEVQAALGGWKAEDFETKANASGCVVSMMRQADEWLAHPQAAAIARLPVFDIVKIDEAAPRPLPASGDRPLSGLRVLDLTRIVAGPVGGRTLAAYGADVMLISSPKLPFIDWLVKDTGRGKLSAHADLDTGDGRAALTKLLAGADIISQGYRPNGIAARGFSPEDAARIRPGIVYVTLSAYSHEGPWSPRRGFDSLVQTATGFNAEEGRAAGTELPRELPAQALDHASGYFMALGAMMARLRQSREGGSWLVRVSLAQTARWVWELGRIGGGFTAKDPSLDEVQDLLEDSASPFGTFRAVRHAAQLPETPARWTRPAVPLGTHEPRWP